MMYRMNTRCTNNQAKAFAIHKALEYVHTKLDNEVDKVTTVHTDSITTRESLNIMYKHISYRRNQTQSASDGEQMWTTRFRWTKAHVRTTGNELANKLAKEASSKIEIPISCNRVPKCVIKRDLEDNSRENWQKEWETTNKGTKKILPDSSGENKNKNKPNTTLNEPSDGPREHKIISTQV